MKSQAMLLMVEQALKLHRKGKLDEEDCLASIRGALMLSIPPAAVPDGTASRRAPALTQPFGTERPLLRAALRVDAPFDIDDPDPAMKAICGPLLKDYAKGRTGHGGDLDAKAAVMEQVERRAVEIRAERQRLLDGGQPQGCADCGDIATVTVMGAPYCAAHAALHKPDKPIVIANEGAPEDLEIEEDDAA